MLRIVLASTLALGALSGCCCRRPALPCCVAPSPSASPPRFLVADLSPGSSPVELAPGVAGAEQPQVFLDITFVRMSEGAAGALLGADVGPATTTLRFDSAKSTDFFFRLKDEKFDATLVAAPKVLTLDGNGVTVEVAGTGAPADSDAATSLVVHVIPRVIGDQVQLACEATYRDASASLALSATESVRGDGPGWQALVLLSASPVSTSKGPSRYALVVTPRILRSKDVALVTR